MFNPVGAPYWPKGEPNDEYSKYFTGQSYLNPLPGGYANVTFEPGCRNNWHIHHGAVQVLICISGRGCFFKRPERAFSSVSSDSSYPS